MNSFERYHERREQKRARRHAVARCSHAACCILLVWGALTLVVVTTDVVGPYAGQRIILVAAPVLGVLISTWLWRYRALHVLTLALGSLAFALVLFTLVTKTGAPPTSPLNGSSMGGLESLGGPWVWFVFLVLYGIAAVVLIVTALLGLLAVRTVPRGDGRAVR